MSPVRGRIIAQSVTEPWTTGPRATATPWGEQLFLATSRPCQGGAAFSTATVIGATSQRPEWQPAAQSLIGTQPWYLRPFKAPELANVVMLTNATSPMLRYRNIATPGKYVLEVTCQKSATGELLSTFTGELTINQDGWVDLRDVPPFLRGRSQSDRNCS